jgi:hypothetical protein
MTYPTPEQIAHMVNTMSNADWTKLGSRLCTAIDRERRGGSAIPDGFPMRGGRSAPGPTQTGETGQDGEDHSRVDWTSVEAAGNARATARDEHHDRTVNAVGYLQQAVQSLCALVTHLDRIEARVVQAIVTDDDWCVSCQRDGGYLEPTATGRYARAAPTTPSTGSTRSATGATWDGSAMTSRRSTVVCPRSSCSMTVSVASAGPRPPSPGRWLRPLHSADLGVLDMSVPKLHTCTIGGRCAHG